MERPRIIINCAMSADGKIASPTGKQIRISCEDDIKRMYHLRNNCDAVLVGINTILADDPKLTVKEKYVKHPRQPLRVVLDSKGRIPANALVLNETANTLILTAKGNEGKLKKIHQEVVGLNVEKNGYINLKEILELLLRRGVKTLLVEGGGTVIWNFLHHKLVDEFYVYINPSIIGGKNTPTVAEGKGIHSKDDIITMKIIEVRQLGPGLLVHYQLAK